jgi:hypothetical protein
VASPKKIHLTLCRTWSHVPEEKEIKYLKVTVEMKKMLRTGYLKEPGRVWLQELGKHWRLDGCKWCTWCQSVLSGVNLKYSSAECGPFIRCTVYTYVLGTGERNCIKTSLYSLVIDLDVCQIWG